MYASPRSMRPVQPSGASPPRRQRGPYGKKIMQYSPIVLLLSGILAWPAWAQSRDAELDKMIAAGKSPRELAQYLFDTHGCKDCHAIGKEGKLGFTRKGEERAQRFEGCISTLKAMSVIAKVPENQR